LSGTPSAEAFIARYAPSYAAGAEGVEFLGGYDAKKNAVIRFRHGGRDLVLKVYRQNWRYALQAARSFSSRWGSRAFALRSRARQRLRSEVACTRAFSAAGFGTFELVEQTGRLALVFAFEYGSSLRDLLDAGAAGRDLVARASEELGRRQSVALRTDDRYLVHPAPRLHHIWVAPGGRLLHHDFEDRVNPSLRIDEALALELLDWLHYVARADPADDHALLRASMEAVGEDALDRVTSYVAARRFGWLSGSFRKHSAVLPRVVAIRAELDAVRGAAGR